MEQLPAEHRHAVPPEPDPVAGQPHAHQAAGRSVNASTWMKGWRAAMERSEAGGE
jgi:hypothetical protein